MAHQAQQSVQRIVGYDWVEVDALAPNQALQNINGDNWPNPPWNCDYVTYCYLKAPPINAEAVARVLGVTLYTEPVHEDNDRIAHLIYHGDGQHQNFVGEPILVILVYEEEANGRWLHLVYLHPQVDLSIKKDEIGLSFS